MRTLRLLLVFLGAAVLALANPVPLAPRNPTMLGETVEVKLQKEVADVEGLYEWELWQPKEGTVIYFPLFAAANESPAAVLARSDLELEFNGEPAGLPTPCDAPRAIAGLPANVRVCWFATEISALSSENPAYAYRYVLRVKFRQPLLRGRFYYVPLIEGTEFDRRGQRAWRYQLHARTTTRMPKVTSLGSDYETLGDAVTVYLRNGEIVILE